jgi:hypothetical protein
MSVILRKVSHFMKYGVYWGPCNKTLYPSVYLLLNQKWVEIPPTIYVSDSNWDDKGKHCMIEIAESSGNYWIMGGSFLRGYYTVYDEENGRVGLATHINSDARIKAYDQIPLPVFDIDQATIINIVKDIILASFFAIGGLGIFSSAYFFLYHWLHELF